MRWLSCPRKVSAKRRCRTGLKKSPSILPSAMVRNTSKNTENNMQPFYDPTKTYDENYAEGPFGAFADGDVHAEKKKLEYEFFGFPVNTPIGIPAGPLLNSNFMKGAFDKGFDIAVYKTVRSDIYPCHPFPNVLAVHPGNTLTLERAKSESLI